ncbi:helix-turn-helix transcriptional regulator [Tessaracoccus oleiagri]|uniref:Predicted transcriptional regulator, ArsR family n=1 Tax=Tessaracoccus oleiagri TaxID=686624 RepID=A0A1G9N6D2_9ACTN|nr:helix-turn-helix domain-containing protein [Tessaracoccus oleiagri]SDL82038.1 Predicted transcriptional regulator, ArsR family [Tessaracoccus oleiagri]
MAKHNHAETLSAVASLADPTRRALYDLVASADAPVSRDDAAAALDLPRATAAFHLDRLAKEGLLDVSYRRLSGRQGPGSGRPTKLYALAEAEVSVSLPRRHYDLAAEILVAAVEESAASGEPIEDALRSAATEVGRGIGQELRLDDALTELGYVPVEEPDGSVIMRNCPFHRLVQSHTARVCGMNLDLLTAVAEATGSDRRAVLDPAPGRCCVRIVPS